MLELTVETERRTQLVDVTPLIEALLDGAQGSLVSLFVPHTTAGIVVQAAGAGAEAVAGDVESALERLVDESWPWKHVDEGDRNPWSHVRALLAGSSLSIPFNHGRLSLGTHQAVFLAEFDGPRTRTIVATLTG